jgi:Tfp pilus assembly protein PilX
MQWLDERLRNEEGLILGITLIILGIFTILGISAIIFSTTEVQVAANEKFHKIAFYGAEAARGYVPKNVDLYGVDNTIENTGLAFPNNADASEKQPLSSHQSFNGEVKYNGGSAPPRGSGYEVGTFRAHTYQMTCNGYGPYNSQSQVEAGFYRIGF